MPFPENTPETVRDDHPMV